MNPSSVDLGSADLEEAFRSYRGLLFGLSYRLTGSVEDAQEIVQETFARAIERPPPRTDQPWRPWLVRVAVNLSLDALRQRRRRGYPGPWLPAPLETADVEDTSLTQQRPDCRYEQLESVTFAFLLVLEVLTPQQRAMLILRDVFDYSAREAAEVVGTSEGHARVVLHRARKAMRAYDRSRCRPTPELQERTRHAIEAFMRCIIQEDIDGLTKLLADDVRTVTDGAGEYTALPRPLVGRPQVMRLYLQVARRRAAGARFDTRLVNGLPGLVVEFATTVRRQAPCALLRCELNPEGRIRELHAILGPHKLAAVRADPSRL